MAVKDKQPHKAKRKLGDVKQASPAKKVKTIAEAKIGKKISKSAEPIKETETTVKHQDGQHRRRSKSLQDAIVKWETLRRHDLDTKQRNELISDVLQELKGELTRLASSPTGSRILQACVKYGSAEQRSQILEDLQSFFLELSKSPYAHFLVCRIIDTAPKSATEGFIKIFRGQVVKMLRHPCGSRVINELFLRASGKQRKTLAAEFYGREMVIFSQDAEPKTLSELLSGLDETAKHRVVQQMSINIIPILEKGLLDPIIVHGVLAEYLEAAPASAVADAVEMLAGPPLLHMVHSRPGATVASQVLAMATAKQRKKIIKAMKGHVKVMACDEWAHIVLMAALEHTDDTALLRKSVLPELLANLEELVQEKVACHMFLHLLAPSRSSYVPAHVAALLKPQNVTVLPSKSRSEGTTAGDDAEEGSAEGMVGFSKKDAGVRRQELLGSGKGSLAAELASACAASAAQLLLSPKGSDLLIEAACGAEGGLLTKACPEGVAAVQDAIVSACGEEPSTSNEGPTEPVMENFFGSRALKKLVGRGKGSHSEAAQARNFAAKLWESSMKGRCKQLSASHAAKVLAAVLRFANEQTKESVRKELLTVMKDRSTIEAWGDNVLGGRAEKPVQQQKKKSKKKK